MIRRIESMMNACFDSETIYQDLFQSNPQPMWIYDLQTLCILDVNCAATLHYGYSREEFLGLNLKNLRPAAEIPKMQDALEKLREGNMLFSSGSYKHKKKNGEIIDVQLQGNIISVNGKKAELVIATDITTFLRAQENNFLSLERLRDAQKIARIGYWTRNLNEDLSHWCDEMYHIYGRNPANFIPTRQNLINCFHAEDRYLLSEETFSEVLKNHATDYEHRIITEHGEVRWVFQRVELQLGPDGTPIAIKGIIQDITEKKKTDQKFKAIFDQTSDAIILGSRGCDLLDLNDAALVMLGYSRKELTEHTSYEILKELSIGSQNVIWEQFKAGQANSGTTEIRRRNGSDIIVNYNFRPDIVPGVHLCVITDITDRIQKQNQLLASERRFKALVQEGADLIGILDLAGNYKFVSESSFPILGIRPCEFIGKNAFEFIHPDDREQIMGQFSKLAEVKQISTTPFRFKDSKGNWRWIRTIATNLINDPAIGGIVVSSRDITEAVIKSRALKRSNDRFKLIMQAANEAIYDWDIKNDKIEWGSGFYTIFGYRSDTDNSAEWYANICSDDETQVKAELKKSIEDKNTDVAVSEFRYNKANGEVALVEHRIVFLRNRQGVAIRAVGSLKDITDYKQNLITIQLQNKKLKDIARTQSHVARAPLARMMGLVDLIKNYPNSDIEKSNIIDLFLKSASEFDKVIKAISEQTNNDVP
ncbi:PAS domain S-box protein [Dyadobacter sp. CY107]|uniref:PAS domain-containing protein n=1 Tax=Dyadobacter fanqingshengii TaxID=2906443 RepID=UPI001F2DE574|nr:PAS domain-containing protein [Dyadobacter fanqingshengii]MCF2505173.1 PAS domain S-box protein [Dyadobacter fanqingshengii]